MQLILFQLQAQAALPVTYMDPFPPQFALVGKTSLHNLHKKWRTFGGTWRLQIRVHGLRTAEMFELPTPPASTAIRVLPSQ